MGCFPSSKRKSALPASSPRQRGTPSCFTARYEVKGVIRKAPYSTVLAVVHKDSGVMFTAHTMRKEPVGDVKTPEGIKNREFSLISSLSHPNLTRMMEWLDTKLEYVFITEAYEGSTLYDQVSQSSFSESEVKTIMKQVLSAVAYCHQKKVMHRDLSLESIWVSRLNVKISLFGTLSFFDVEKRTTGRGGSVYYIAPEIISGLYDERCDVWACGVILHILLAGFPPFEGSSELETAAMIREDLLDLYAPRYTHISDDGKDLIHRMLIKNPGYRITAEEALGHPWFKDTAGRVVSEGEARGVRQQLAAFAARSRLKDTLCTFIVTHVLSTKDLATARDLFLRMDRNGDGKLSADEVRAALHSEFGSFHELANMKAIDTDGSGFVDYNEFLKAIIGQAGLTNEQTLKAAFSLLDKDHNGFVTADELREMLLSTGVEAIHTHWEELITEVDSNGDQKIDLAEFVSLLRKV